MNCLTIAEAAECLRVSSLTVKRLIALGELPHVRIGRRRLVVPRERLERWLENRVQGEVEE